MRSGRAACGGSAYLLLLLAIALIGLVAASTVSVGATLARRDAEQQLLAVGREFQTALRSYAGVPLNASTPIVAQGPKSMNDLLKDPRVPGLRRYLRRIYADPLTGQEEWGLVRDVQGSIVGIYSLAAGLPIQQSGFEPSFAGFDSAHEYRKWVFGLPVSGQSPNLPSRTATKQKP